MSNKRRKLCGGVVTISEQQRPRKVSAVFRVQPLDVTSPQELAYLVLTSDKILYTKQEVLDIISRLNQMFSPKFDGECPYIA